MDDNEAKLLQKAAENMGIRTDGWRNSTTGLGTSRDKMSGTEFAAGRQLGDEELDALYAENDMAARICDALPEDAAREGFGIKIATETDVEREQAAQGIEGGAPVKAMAVGEAAEMATALRDRCDELELLDKLTEAWVWGRTFGFGAMVLGVDDGGQLHEPLRESAIRRFTHANVVDRRYVAPITWYTDPTAARYGRPATYLLTQHAIPSGPTSAASALGRPFNAGARASRARAAVGGATEIHESRLVIFDGVRTTIRRRQELNGFSTPLLQRVNTALTQFGVSWDSLAHILQDAYQGVFKMQGLIESIAANGMADVQTRLAIMDLYRSNMRSVALDAETEDFTRLAVQWSGLDKIMNQFMIRLSAAARMPATIMLGQSPAGLNATGESDLTWWYNSVDAARTSVLRPKLERLITLIASAADGPTGGQVPAAWDLTFPRLWTPTETEAAEMRLKQAQADKIYVDLGVVTPAEVATSRFTPNGWSPETTIDLAARREVMDDELDDLGPSDPDEMLPGAPGVPPAPGQPGAPVAPKPPAPEE